MDLQTFHVDELGSKVDVQAPINKEKLLGFAPFKSWLNATQKALSTQQNKDHPFHEAPYKVRSLEIQSVDIFKAHDRIGFMKLKAVITNDNDEWLPGAVFLRGGSVAMMLVLQPDDIAEKSDEDRYVVLTVQPRIAAGSLSFIELPAGMLDNGTFSGTAAREIEEEVGLKIPESELFDMTAAAVLPSSSGEALQDAIYPSPGACDEYIPIFLHQKILPRKDLEEMQGRLTGLRDQGEKIQLKIVKLKDLWREGARDGKTLAALALYSGLKGEGKLPPMVS